MKGLIIYSDFMEDNEALSTTALLRRAKFLIDSATIHDNLIVKTAYGIEVKADKNLAKIEFNAYDFLIIPGGPYVAKIIDDADYIYDTIKAFNEQDKDIYAICAAPRFLGRLGMLDDLKFTAFPGSEKDALNGKYLKDEKVVVTPKIITARSAGAVIDFVYQIIYKNQGKEAAKGLIKNIMY